MTEKKPVPILPSATLLLLRDGTGGLEVFMVKRHHQIDFASGALVFPGGKTAPGDRDPELPALCDGAAGLSEEDMALRACAVREGFEESGILLARPAGCPVLAGPETALRLDDWRQRLDKGEVGLAAFAREGGVRPALDALVPFARWITPGFMPKRFDTQFFLADAPMGQTGRHDGHESVDSLWLRPADALAEGAPYTIIFPTRMNLEKLGRSKTVAEAMARAKAEPIVTVEPKVVEADGKRFLTLPEEAGYGVIREPIERIMG